MAEASNPTQKMKLMLLGRTGAGKSATGNSILNRKVFKVSGKGKSVTAKIETENCSVGSREVEVVDGPGLADTDTGDVEDKIRLIINLGKALYECNGFINALVFVIKYGDRFTPEMQNSVEAVMKIIGDDMMTNFGVVVMTNRNAWSEEFEEEEEINFQDWCRQENETYGGIFERCGYRCVLFENLTKDVKEKKKQRDELLGYVVGIVQSHGAYTHESFEAAKSERDKYIASNKCYQLKEEYQSQISLLTGKMMTINDVLTEDEKSREYEDIIQRAEDLLRQAQEDDAGSGVLADLQEQLNEIIEAAQSGNSQALKLMTEKVRNFKINRYRMTPFSLILKILPLYLETALSLSLPKRNLRTVLAVLSWQDGEIDMNEAEDNSAD